MIASNKLRGLIVEKNTTISSIAKKMGITPYTLGRKIRNLTPMSLSEAQTLCNILGVSSEDFSLYFFAQDDAV